MDFAARGTKFQLSSSQHKCVAQVERQSYQLVFNKMHFFQTVIASPKGFYDFLWRIRCEGFLWNSQTNVPHSNFNRIAWSFQVEATQRYSRHTGSMNIRYQKKATAYPKKLKLIFPKHKRLNHKFENRHEHPSKTATRRNDQECMEYCQDGPVISMFQLYFLKCPMIKFSISIFFLHFRTQ